MEDALRTAVVDPAGECSRRLESHSGPVVKWWEVRPDGLEQGWKVSDGLEGDRSLVFDVMVEGGDVSAADDTVFVQSDGGLLVEVGGVVAWDADRQPLSATLWPLGRGFRVKIDDVGVRFPISVDPIYVTPAWTFGGGADSQGLGFALAAAGDVNVDGCDDVLVSAPGGGQVFLYAGSAAGAYQAAASTLGGGNVGFSIAAAGDENGDGYDDVVFGSDSDDEVLVYHGGVGLVAGWRRRNA